MKTCTKCHLTKSTSEFSKRKSAKDGLYSWCHTCNSDNSKRYYRTQHPKKCKIIPEYKQCSQCLVTKYIDQFKNDNRIMGGRQAKCKLCDSLYQKIKRQCDPSIFKLRAAKTYRKNKNNWLVFFQEHYGEIPQCEICHKKIKWQSDIKTNSHDVVNWDHYTKQSLKVKTVPSSWLASHICNNENQSKWLLFNFGILCNSCNPKLPTLNREAWLESAIAYVRGKNGIRV